MAVFFFLLCAAVCIQAFVKADLLSKRAADLNQSVLIAKVQLKSGRQKEKQADSTFRWCEKGFPGETYTMMFDKKGNAADQSHAAYYGEVKLISELEAEVTVSKAGNTLYTLAVSGTKTLE